MTNDDVRIIVVVTPISAAVILQCSLMSRRRMQCISPFSQIPLHVSVENRPSPVEGHLKTLLHFAARSVLRNNTTRKIALQTKLM